MFKQTEDDGFQVVGRKGKETRFHKPTDGKRTNNSNGYKKGNSREYKKGNSKEYKKGNSGNSKGGLTATKNRFNNTSNTDYKINFDRLLSKITIHMIDTFIAKNALPTATQLFLLSKDVAYEFAHPSETCNKYEKMYRKKYEITDQTFEKIEASVIYKLMPIVIIYAIKQCEFDVKKYIINELGQTIVKTGTYASGQGFLPLNQIFWSKEISSQYKESKQKEDLIVQKMLEIISAFRKLGINPMDRNSKGETSLDSYKEGAKAGKSPWSTEIVTALQYGDLTALIRELINKISPKMSDRLRTSFKYVVMHGLDDLCRGLITSLLSSYVYAKKEGVHDRVTNFLNMTIEFLKIRSTEDVDNDYTYSEETVNRFLTALASNSQLILTEEKPTDLTGENQWSVDVIGGIISEISVLLESPSIFTFFFESQYSIIESSAVKETRAESESQILTLMSHLIHRLKLNTKVDIKEFLTPKICHCLQNIVSNKKISPRVRILIESQITAYMSKQSGKTVKMVNLSEIAQLFHSGSYDELDCDDTKEKENEVDQNDNDYQRSLTLACYRVQDIIDLNVEPKFTANGLPKFVQIGNADYCTAPGYRILADALHNGTSTGLSAFKNIDNDTLQRMVICNIAYNVANDIRQLAPKEEQVDNINDAIDGIKCILNAHCGNVIVNDALKKFTTDLRVLDNETLSCVWDNPNGKDNFGRFCKSFGIQAF